MDIILLELLLVLGVVIGLGVWQLYDVNKAIKKHDGETDLKQNLTDQNDQNDQNETPNQQDER